MKEKIWLTAAQNLQTGHTTRHDCPQCGLGTNTNAAIVNHNPKVYTIHCYACDYNDFQFKGVMTLEERQRIKDLNNATLTNKTTQVELPEDTVYDPTEFSYEARRWLYSNGLTPTAWKRYRVGYSRRLERVILPIYDNEGNLTWYQCRAILEGQRPKYIQPSGDRSNILYYAEQPHEDCSSIVLVEDIMSAIRVTQAGSTACSLLGTKVSTAQATLLSRFETLTLWLDSDRAGRQGTTSIKRTLSMVCQNVRSVVTEKDPKTYSNKQINEVLKHEHVS